VRLCGRCGVRHELSRYVLFKLMKFCAICKAVQASVRNKKACVAARAQPPAQQSAPAVVLADASSVEPPTRRARR